MRSRARCRLVFAVIAGLLVANACAPKQRIPLDVAPHGARLYLDGEPVEALPPELELRADRDHKLFFKSEGHRPELVVLRTATDADGRSKLEPAAVRLRLVPLSESGRQVLIESEESR